MKIDVRWCHVSSYNLVSLGIYLKQLFIINHALKQENFISNLFDSFLQQRILQRKWTSSKCILLNKTRTINSNSIIFICCFDVWLWIWYISGTVSLCILPYFQCFIWKWFRQIKSFSISSLWNYRIDELLYDACE